MKLFKNSTFALFVASILSFTACSNDDDNEIGTDPVSPSYVLDSMQITEDKTDYQILKLKYDKDYKITKVLIDGYNVSETGKKELYTVSNYIFTRNGNSVTIDITETPTDINPDKDDFSDYRIKINYDNAGNLTEKLIYKDDKTTLEKKITYTWTNGRITKYTREYMDESDSDIENINLTYDNKGNVVSIITEDRYDGTPNYSISKSTTQYKYSTRPNVFYRSFPFELIVATNGYIYDLVPTLSAYEMSEWSTDRETKDYDNISNKLVAENLSKEIGTYAFTYNNNDGLPAQISSVVNGSHEYTNHESGYNDSSVYDPETSIIKPFYSKRQ